MQSFDRCQVPADGVCGQTFLEVASEGAFPSNVVHERRALSEDTEQMLGHKRALHKKAEHLLFGCAECRVYRDC